MNHSKNDWSIPAVVIWIITKDEVKADEVDDICLKNGQQAAIDFVNDRYGIEDIREANRQLNAALAALFHSRSCH